MAYELLNNITYEQSNDQMQCCDLLLKIHGSEFGRYIPKVIEFMRGFDVRGARILELPVDNLIALLGYMEDLKKYQGKPVLESLIAVMAKRPDLFKKGGILDVSCDMESAFTQLYVQCLEINSEIFVSFLEYVNMPLEQFHKAYNSKSLNEIHMYLLEHFKDVTTFCRDIKVEIKELFIFPPRNLALLIKEFLSPCLVMLNDWLKDREIFSVIREMSYEHLGFLISKQLWIYGLDSKLKKSYLDIISLDFGALQKLVESDSASKENAGFISTLFEEFPTKAAVSTTNSKAEQSPT